MARNKTESAADAPLRRAEPDAHWTALRPGDRVNIETDILARHILRMNEFQKENA